MKIFFGKFFILFLIVYLCSCTAENTIVNPPTDNSPEEIEDPVQDPLVIKLENWYLSVPVDAGGGYARSIGYEDIVDGALTPEEAQYFYKNEEGSYTMWTQFTGFTTSGFSELGDKYCRTELREYWRGNQDVNDNWSMSTGIHILESTMHVDFVEGNGRTIVAQIHGKESQEVDGSPATVKIRWNSGMIQIDYYTKPESNDPWTSQYDEKVDFGRVDNELFTFKMKIENGILYCALVCEAKGIDTPYTEIYDYVGNGYIHENYFKTGNYFAWNEDYENAAQVVLYKVITTHK